MKKYRLLILVVFILFISNSCNKENDTKTNEVTCLLKMYNGGGAYSTDFTYNIEYDSQKRPVEISYSNADGDISIYRATEFTNGKVSKYICSKNGEDIFYEKYEWEGNKITIKYYSIYGNEWINDEKYILEYDSNEQLKKLEYSLSDDGFYFEKRYFEIYNWRNGNVSSTERYYINSKSGVILPIWNKHKPLLNEKTTSSLKSISEEIDYIVTYSEYDDKENWASSLGLFFPTDGLSKNNPISYTFKYPDGITETYFDVYQYNDLNYPIERYIYNNFNSNSYYYNYENYCK